MGGQQSNPFGGFYSAYFAGTAGNSFGVFVFKEGLIAGADAGGGKYDGIYEVSDDGKTITGSVSFIIPIGHQTITGAAATTEPISFDVPIKLPTEINKNEVFRIETPAGPVNAKFEKIKGF